MKNYYNTKTKSLPNGIYSKNQYVLTVIYLIICLFIGIGIGLLCVFKDLNLLIILLIVMPIIFFISIFVVANFNQLFKADMKYKKNADPEEYIKKIDSLLQNNLHPDSRIFLMLMKANVYFAYDKEKAYEIFQYIKFPENKKIRIIFMQVKAMYYINRGEIEEAKKVLETMILNKYNAAAIDAIKTNIDVLNPEIEIKDIEKKCKLQNTFILIDVLNANILMKYYFIRKDFQKSKMYSHMILSKQHKLYEITKSAELINKIES